MKIPEFIISERVVNNMKKLYPKHEVSIRVNEYYSSKIKQAAMILTVGMALILLISFSGDNSLIENGKIRRNSYGDGDKEVLLSYELIDKDIEDIMDDSSETENSEPSVVKGEISFNICEKEYNTTQICKMIDKFKEELLEIILAGNKSQDYITSDLHFIESIEGYPFHVEYQTDKPLVITREGILKQDNLTDEGTDVTITLDITYADYEEYMTFSVCAYKRALSLEESMLSDIRLAVELENERTKECDYFALPSEINGKTITFLDKNTSSGFLLIAFLIVSVVALFVGKDKDIEKEVKRRDIQLKDEYPRFLNRFTLFYTAGMPVKTIFLRMVSEYGINQDSDKDENYLYEELKVLERLLNDGVNEIDAYEELSARVALPEYRAFIGLIMQDLRNGRKDLAMLLRHEAQNAFNEKINGVKKLLEEAATKLLAPMFMMLIVVMVMVMFPAFLSFR